MKTFLNKEYQNISIGSDESNTPMLNYGDQLPLKLFLTKCDRFYLRQTYFKYFYFLLYDTLIQQETKPNSGNIAPSQQ